MSTESNTGRVAVITGASSGIGEATARALVAGGYRVALLARRAERIQALADELGDGAVAIEADVTDRESVVSAAQRVEDELGGTDVLVSNAGVMLLAPFTSDQRAEQRQMVEVNLLGAMTATEVFLDQLRDGGGDLINISSVAGRTARAGNAAYAATKWGLNGWSEALRQELQPDVRVIVIEPDAVATELTDHITHGETKQGVEQFYQGTAITAADIAEIIAFAASRPRSVSLNEILVRPTVQGRLMARLRTGVTACICAAALVAAGCGGESTNAPPAPGPQGSRESVRSYRDGQYEAKGWYGGQPSSIDVAFTLLDDRVTDVEVTPNATNPTSLDYQERFAEAVPDVVVGKRLDEVRVSRVAGSSGTPDGFNQAVERIKDEAAE